MSQTLGAPEKHCATCRCGQPKKKRSGGGITRTSADVRWSKDVRERADQQCQFIDFEACHPGAEPEAARCYKRVPDHVAQLDAAHCYGRACKVCTGSRGGWRKPHECTRLDPDNGLAMCWPHHTEIDQDRALKYAIFTWWLGSEAFDALSARAKAKRNR